jgi:hypothetical protein
MTTQTKSRLLLTVLVAPPLALSFYWLFGGNPLWGLIVLVSGLALLAWVWWPGQDGEKKKES